MLNRKLVALIAAGTLLFFGHTVDHAIRDNLRWPSTEFFVFVIISLVVYGAVGIGLYQHAKGRVGPRFWAIFAFAGVFLGWASHFSPFTDQPPSYILSMYRYGFAGWLALGVLLGLMLVMGIAGIYAAYLWQRGSQARKSDPRIENGNP